MASTSARYITVTFSEDSSGTHRVAAALNEESAASIEVFSLDSGDNTITVPTGGTLVTAVTIIPPADNTDVAILLKGDAADVGVALHRSDPTSLGIDTDQTEFILNVDDDLDLVRFIWS